MHQRRGLLPNVQMMRGLAALLVIVAHLAASLVHSNLPNPLPDLTYGDFGVDLFFVISGFIMYHTTTSDIGFGSAWRFLCRRIIRIAPMYWIFTSVAFAQMLIAFGREPIPVFQKWHVFASYFFWPFQEIEGENGVYPIYPIGWTLQYEMMFYAIFAFSITVFSKLRLHFIALFFSFIVIAGQFNNLPLPFAFWADPIIFEFVFGMVIAWIFRSSVEPSIWSTVILALAAILVIIYEKWSGIDAEDNRVFWWGLPAAALLLSAVFLPQYKKRRLGVALEKIGDASYSLYLVHPLFYDCMIDVWHNNKVTDRLPYRVWLPTMVIGAILCSLAFYLTVEAPLTRVLQVRLLGRPSAVPASPIH